MILIEVKDEFIACGTRRHCCHCPTALAITETTGARVTVGPRVIQINNLIISTPEIVRQWINNYDLYPNMRHSPYFFHLPIHLKNEVKTEYEEYKERNNLIILDGERL